MYLVKHDGLTAVVPGLLLGYRGEAMMPEYTRYMKMLPCFIAAHALTAAMSAYGLIQGNGRPVLLAYAIFMAALSLNLLTRRLVRVRFRGLAEPALSAPLSVRFNAGLIAASLAMMGAGFMRMRGEFDTVLFDVFGGVMIGLSAAWMLSLHRRGAIRLSSL